ncbi:unnamed protein product [Arctogadus glacialis]
MGDLTVLGVGEGQGVLGGGGGAWSKTDIQRRRADVQSMGPTVYENERCIMMLPWLCEPVVVETEPKGTVVMETGPKGTVFVETGPKGTVVMETGPKGAVVMETGPKGTVVMETGPNGTVVMETGPKGAVFGD